MMSTIPVALEPATAAVVLAGLEPVFWATVGLVATAATLVVRDLLDGRPSGAAPAMRPGHLQVPCASNRLCDAA